MNWYKLLKLAQKGFIGDCITGLEDPQFQNYVASDATELAQLVDRGKQITFEEFANMAYIKQIMGQFINNPDNYEFYIDEATGIAWYYDIEKDIEYFYI